MHAIRLHSAAGAEGLTYDEIPAPEPGPGEALVRVHAAAITRDELEWPIDRLPTTPSYELSGTVAGVGPDVTRVEIGDPVFALTDFNRDGVAADYALVAAELLAPKPATLDDIEAAAIPLPGLSAWQGLFEHGQLGPGQRVLIHGATGGVGQFATQLARHRGAYVVATVSTGNVERARALGASEVIDHTTTPFDEEIDPVDLVFDTAGGDRLARSPRVIQPGGRLVSIAEEPPTQTTTGQQIKARYFVVEPNRAQLIELGELVDHGELRPSVDAVFELRDARAAFERVQSRAGAGKVVLRVTTPNGRDHTGERN
jgi:NADPH:quinone reductase-like Zn-dependent oxidoreductase